MESSWMTLTCSSRYRWAFKNTRSSGVICLRSPSPLPKSTVCGSSRLTRSSQSRGSGTSSGASTFDPITPVYGTNPTLRQLKKVKKANGEIIGVNVVCRTLAAIQEAGVWDKNTDPYVDSRKEALEGQELRYLDSLRLAFWYT